LLRALSQLASVNPKLAITRQLLSERVTLFVCPSQSSYRGALAVTAGH
jgi:hypothetical protein